MAKLYLNPNRRLSKIHKEIYGHFSEHLGRCIYEGLYVGEDSPIPNENGMRKDVVSALKEMRIPVLRWPGGCFADEYHWMDGIGPKASRKKMINTHWGGVVEDNSFGTHEFMELCRQLGCEAYINGNLGSGTVREMSEWVEYLTFDGVSPMADLRKENGREKPWEVSYFGVGNENWGCGGNMTPEYYANEYRRYQTYVRNYPNSEHPEHKIYKIACGPNSDDYSWTEAVMKTAGRFMDGLSLHYYTVPETWQKKGSATSFTEEEYYRTLKKTVYMEELIKNHLAVMDHYDREHRVDLIIDEWGSWYDCEPGTNPGFLYQQNTMRDALIAGINLNLFNKHSDRIRMANIAQLVNVLQAVILTEGEKLVLTPTYHVFHMYQEHQEAELIESFIETETVGVCEESMVPNLFESASIKDDCITLTLTNLSLEKEYPVSGTLIDSKIHSAAGTLLTGRMTDHNTFAEPERITRKEFNSITVHDGSFAFTIPPCSVLKLSIQREKSE